MKRILLISLLLTCGKGQAQTVGFYLDGRVSSPVSRISHLKNDWQIDGEGDYLYSQYKFGAWLAVNERVQLGFERRQHHYINFSNETALFNSRLESHDLAPGHYEVSLDYHSVEAQGFFTRYLLNVSDDLNMSLTMYVLKGISSQLLQLSGFGEVNPDGSYMYQYELDYAYSDNELLDVQSAPISGYAHSFDFELNYAVAKDWQFKLSMHDLLYRMYWTKINQDKGCFARPTPVGCLLSTDQTHVVQSLPAEGKASVFKAYKKGDLFIEMGRWGRHKSLYVGGLYQEYVLSADLVNETYNLGYESDRLAVKWSFDHLDFNRAKHWQVSLNTNWPIL